MNSGEDKKSFVLYADYSEHVALLSDEEAGMLFKAIFAYVKGEKNIKLSPIVSMAFSFIKAQLDRDMGKWEEIRKKRAIAGSLGGKAKGNKQKVAKQANAISDKQKVAKQAVTDNGTEYVNVTDNGKCNTYFSHPGINQAFLDFIEMRKQIKKPMTERAITLMVNKLEKMTSDTNEQIEILNQSVLNGWQGIFPLKEQKEQVFTKKPKFNDFQQNQYDFDTLERELLANE